MHPDLLNSWKEIAAYLGRGVRTVQRWEIELRLPVHRPHRKARTAVIASRSELNDWLRVQTSLPSHAVKVSHNIALLRAYRLEQHSRFERLKETVQNTRRLVASLSLTAKKKSDPETHENPLLQSTSSSRIIGGKATVQLAFSTPIRTVVNFKPKILPPMQESTVADTIARAKKLA